MEYVVWLVIMGILIAIEASTANFVTIWFAIGAFGATLGSVFGMSVFGQICLFVALSVVSLILTKPLVTKKLNFEKAKTNADAVIGKTAVVCEDITGDKFAGRVKADGKDWSAISADGSDILKDTVVVVKDIQGVRLVVEKIKDTANV